jgi:hypothetical protein
LVLRERVERVALVAVAAAAVRMDWEGMGHVAGFVFQL